MGKAQSKHDESERHESVEEELDEVQRVLEEKGVAGAQDMMRRKLQKWKDVQVKIGVTGASGVGKSRFINAIRGLSDEDEGAAQTGVIETTFKPASYSYPGNPHITLVDLPGIGTPSFPNLDTYCEKVRLETYDTFLILTATRFKKDELDLAVKIKDMEKSFFLIRTKIDQDELNENRKTSPDIEAMKRQIRANCYENVQACGIDEDKVFLISNYHSDMWDFPHLVQAILKQLPDNQKEALTLSLRILSEDILKRKVQFLRSRLWRNSILFFLATPLDVVALPISVIGSYVLYVRMLKDLYRDFKTKGLYLTLFPKPDVSEKDSDPLENMVSIGYASISIALAIIGKKAEFFRCQLGLPEENSDDFKLLKPKFQERMKKFYQKDGEDVLKRALEFLVKPFAINPKGAHETALCCLHQLLSEMQDLALDILKETAAGN